MSSAGTTPGSLIEDPILRQLYLGTLYDEEPRFNRREAIPENPDATLVQSGSPVEAPAAGARFTEADSAGLLVGEYIVAAEDVSSSRSLAQQAAPKVLVTGAEWGGEWRLESLDDPAADALSTAAQAPSVGDPSELVDDLAEIEDHCEQSPPGDGKADAADTESTVASSGSCGQGARAVDDDSSDAEQPYDGLFSCIVPGGAPCPALKATSPLLARVESFAQEARRFSPGGSGYDEVSAWVSSTCSTAVVQVQELFEHPAHASEDSASGAAVVS